MHTDGFIDGRPDGMLRTILDLSSLCTKELRVEELEMILGEQANKIVFSALLVKDGGQVGLKVGRKRRDWDGQSNGGILKLKAGWEESLDFKTRGKYVRSPEIIIAVVENTTCNLQKQILLAAIFFFFPFHDSNDFVK